MSLRSSPLDLLTGWPIYREARPSCLASHPPLMMSTKMSTKKSKSWRRFERCGNSRIQAEDNNLGGGGVKESEKSEVLQKSGRQR